MPVTASFFWALDFMFQANLGNVREFKLAMKTLKAERMANFRVALTEAFKSFNTVR